MSLENIVLFAVGAAAGYYVVCHYLKTGQAA